MNPTSSRRGWFRISSVGVVFWAVAAASLGGAVWLSIHDGINETIIALGWMSFFSSLIGGFVFLRAAAKDPLAKAINCGGCAGIFFMFFIFAVVSGTIRSCSRNHEAVRETNERFLLLNQVALDVEAFRASHGRLPHEGKELTEALHGKPMPCFYKDFQVSYRKDDTDHYNLSCSFQHFWGVKWDIFGWIFEYSGPEYSRRLQAIFF